MRAMRLRLYHHRDGARVAYRETGTGPPLVLLHSLGLSHREWEPIVAAAFAPLPGDPARSAAARRLRGPPAPPVHARLDGRRDRRLLPRGGWAAPARWPDTTSAPSWRCRSLTSGRLEVARLVLMPNRLHRRDQFGGNARRLADRLPDGRAARARPRAGPRREAGLPALLRRAPLSAAQPGRARPPPPRVCRCRRQRQPRALVGQVRPSLAGRRRRASCSTLTRGSPCRCCCCGPTRIRPTRCSAPRRRWTCFPSGQLRTLAGNGLPDGLRRSGRSRTRADRVLRLTALCNRAARGLEAVEPAAPEPRLDHHAAPARAATVDRRQRHPDRDVDEPVGVPVEARQRRRQQCPRSGGRRSRSPTGRRGSSARAHARRRRPRRRSSPRSRTRRSAGDRSATPRGRPRSPARARRPR